jgi:hypothetical protein
MNYAGRFNKLSFHPSQLMPLCIGKPQQQEIKKFLFYLLGAFPKNTQLGEDDNVFEKYDRLKVELALSGALKNPRVAAWSPTSAMILNYFKSTRPRSDKSLSSEIDEILAEGLIKRYPELYQAFQIVINETNSVEITHLKDIKKDAAR